MRLAFAISAHRDLDLLNSLIKQILYNDNCFVFIHIDRKSTMPLNSIVNDVRVRIIDERVSVEWGDFSHINAINTLFRIILADDKSYDYVTLLSGQDLLIKPVDVLIEFLENQTEIELYMDIAKLPIEGWTHGGGFERIALHYPKIFRQRYKKNHPIHIIRAVYSRLYKFNFVPKKKMPYSIEFWGRSAWFTVSTSLINESLKYINDNPWYDNFFKDSLIPDEIYHPTLFMNLANKNKIITDNNFEYIDWNNPEKSERSSPKTFVMSDISAIESSGKFFARKFSSDKDREIIDYFCKKTNGSSSKKKI